MYFWTTSIENQTGVAWGCLGVLDRAPVYIGNWNYGIEHFQHMEFCQLEFWHMEL